MQPSTGHVGACTARRPAFNHRSNHGARPWPAPSGVNSLACRGTERYGVNSLATRRARATRCDYITGNGRYVGQRLHTRVDS
eukprot:1654768-Prymnesium_polylepis.1